MGDKLSGQAQGQVNEWKGLDQIEIGYKNMRNENLSAPNLYLRGLIHKKRGDKEKAKSFFIQALQKMPLLWSAWLEYGSILKENA